MKDIFASIPYYKKWLSGRAGSFSENAAFFIERIREIDRDIKAFATFDERKTLERASELEAFSEKNGLWGVPIGIKSNICVKGALTTCCSRMLEDFRPPYDAHVIEKLGAEGVLTIEGLNMDEFAFGSSCETSYYGPTMNPWDTGRIPGGSSGGAAAAVAAGEIPAALGSDTGGSIRQPASMCGVVGLKPTYGRVSRYGLIAFASSLDQIGPITRTVEDCARILQVIAGFDERDSTCVDMPVPAYTDCLDREIKGLRIGIPAEYFSEGVSPVVRQRIDEAISVFRDLGAETVDISLPHTGFAVACYCIVSSAEASSNLARYDGAHYGYRTKSPGDIFDMYVKTRDEGFGPEVKRRILLGTYSLSAGYYEAYYLKAQKVRTLISEDFKKAFEACDIILTPASPTTAFKAGEKLNDPLKMYLSDIFTISSNLAGLPAISIPCGLGENDMPVGLQLMARPFDEQTILRASHAFERNTGHHKMNPPVLIEREGRGPGQKDT